MFLFFNYFLFCFLLLSILMISILIFLNIKYFSLTLSNNSFLSFSLHFFNLMLSIMAFFLDNGFILASFGNLKLSLSNFFYLALVFLSISIHFSIILQYFYISSIVYLSFSSISFTIFKGRCFSQNILNDLSLSLFSISMK